MKIRQAWKMWKNDDFSSRFPEAMRTIETRTRRYYRNLARKSVKQGDKVMYKYYAHTAESPFLMEDILYHDGERNGKSYHIW